MHEKRFEGDISRLRSPERMERLEVERVVDLCLEDGRSKNMLDVGTGTALFAEAFAKHGLKIAGVDANPAMLAAARQFVLAGDFREGTAEALPFPNGSFDLVFLGLVLHESDEPLKTLQEARRVARQWVAILEWPYREGVFGPPLAHRLEPESLADEFRKAGFRKWKLTELSNTVFYLLEA
jgi:SAM-dependent methyltransferase